MTATPNATANPAGSSQTPDGRVIRDAAPVYDANRGHLMPAGHNDADQPQHQAARSGTAGHQRRR